MSSGTKRHGGNSWTRSARFMRVALAALEEINSNRHKMTKCTAKAKSSGERCKNLPLRGKTKCLYHGGRTGSGDQWHVRTWPKPSDPKAMEKIHRKLTEAAKSAKVRDARLASLSPELRARYTLWLLSHRPGPKGARRRAKEQRRQDAEAAAFMQAALNSPEPPPTPELQDIYDRIAALRAEKAAMNAPNNSDTPLNPDDQERDGERPGAAPYPGNFTEGVFG